MQHYDFCGYATRNDIRCSDGRTIRRNAFAENDGKTVPLVWQHRHDSPSNVLGHALLENRDDGVYAYCSFNDSMEAQDVKIRVQHGDIRQMSIYANKLRQTRDGDVMHGVIREVSLVLSGANPGAWIDAIDIQHSDDPEYDEELSVEIYTGEDFTLMHADDEKRKKPTIASLKKEAIEDEDEEEDEENKSETNTKKSTDDSKEEKEMAKTEKTVADVFNELTEEQKKVVYFMIGEAIKQARGGNNNDDDDDDDEKATAKHYDYDEGDYFMHSNVFEKSAEREFLAHADEFFDNAEEVFKDAKKRGSLKEAVIEHAATYGIDNIDYLFPDARTLTDKPEFIRRSADWVNDFMDKAHKSPFSRIKSIFADITEADARARGYIKGNMKKDEVFALLRRVTTPTTVYKKQKLDRDDIADITDFDVIAWLKQEMRWMLDEEIARAALVGDGRSNVSDDKINETNIRPIWTDDDLYTIKVPVTVASTADDDTRSKALIRGIVKARKSYKGTGNPIFFTTEDTLTDMLLLEDGVGRPLYDTIEKLATKLRVSKIVTVEVMENLTRVDSDSQTRSLVGIIVNPADYNFGADKGGEIALFDDFDIDYNQQKYLIETRLSGALTKPYSAMAIELITASGASSNESNENDG